MEEKLRSELVDAAVRRTATFSEAANVLLESGLAAIAVVDERRWVVGLFGVRELLRGLFPRYLGELRHTAFLEDDLPGLAELAARVSREPVAAHMAAAETVDLDSSSTHLAERFLHSAAGAIAVVRGHELVGMLGITSFCRTLQSRLEGFGDSRSTDDAEPFPDR